MKHIFSDIDEKFHCGFGDQVDLLSDRCDRQNCLACNRGIVKSAMELLVQQMEERKKRRPVSLSKPIHKQITPVLIRRDTTS